MATLASASPSPSRPFKHRRKGCARRCEYYCCRCITVFPLTFVYGLTTWAVWVQTSIGLLPARNAWTGHASAAIGIALYTLLNWCYTTAVFVSPGSPSNSTNPHTALPIQEMPNQLEREPSTLMAKSSGELRFCKKCHARKPDRAHHCSTCNRCVLKMDHHCPWLATCVGLRNYKPFILFLLYTCAFCFWCCAVSTTWVWQEVLGIEGIEGIEDRLMPVNYILLAVLGGIIGIVLSGFTGWHIWLVVHGQTTIESLEQVRYLSPVKHNMQARLEQRQYVGAPHPPSLGEQLREIHANALPGVTRPEEGEEREPPARRSVARDSLHQSYQEMERSTARAQYEEYLDDQDSEKLPNAFDHGCRRNLAHVFGENPWLRWLPVCNTTGDGWYWEASSRWHEVRRELAKEREAQDRENAAFEGEWRGWRDSRSVVDFRDGSSGKLQQAPGGDVSMQNLPPRKTSSQHNAPQDRFQENDYHSSDDGDNETLGDRRRLLSKKRSPGAGTPTANWNDLPGGFMDDSSPRTNVRARSPRPKMAFLSNG